MTTDEELADTVLMTKTATSIVDAIESRSREGKIELVANSISVIVNGIRNQVLAVVDNSIIEAIGPLYAGPGKLKARVQALEALERVAREVLVNSYDPILARGALLAALVNIDATEAPKTG